MEVGRFAPSPSGRMHLGNVFAALLAWLSVRSAGGEMVLRIEDLDRNRCTAEYERLLREDLLWLGLDWDREQRPQRLGDADYEAVLDRLADRVYPCWCSRSTLSEASAPHASDGHVIYPGTCRDLTEAQRAAQTRPAALRLRVPEETIRFTDGVYGPCEEDLANQCGDFVLRRADGGFTYQLAVVADDIAAGVTQVVRGRDLLSSTPRQIFLYRLLDRQPPNYFHIPLLLAPDGRRLSKRERDRAMDVLRRELPPQALIGTLAHAAGLIDADEPVSPSELARQFSWDRLRPADIVVGEGSLRACRD
ncbi:MAG: tRNA glutamyl-Q(34) synthetase GluQRS [Oscillospiraceae bacterium]|nr:tRNA glutamyl-Q(34) synthetase GluQRS [Oscillospiraceae bacterium]